MHNKKKFLITISYDGSHYSGWQIQHNSTSIQLILEQKLSMLLRHEVTLTGSGRTDSGVHALAQKAHFETENTLDESNFLYRLNSVLPKDIRVLAMEAVSENFHARFDVVKKTYQYMIYNHPIMDPFLNNKAWHIPYKLDYELMVQALSLFEGTHDFKAFAAKNTQGSASVDSIRYLEHFRMRKEGHLIILELTSKGFLYKMVRNLVGCLICIGSHKLDIEIIQKAFQDQNRGLIGETAPAHGLYLKEVNYV